MKGESDYLRPEESQSSEAAIDQISGRELTPELAALCADNCKQLLARLDAMQRKWRCTCSRATPRKKLPRSSAALARPCNASCV